ncbi:hypothetical protein [Teredinibacter turnerae]|uniref:hypothetical protein n=1 Tax=Teredinibacter turnerae TaxID=2426 RepID=UPI0004098E50|nr:hypothetical protein [Teredinibacter turnerae]
MFNIFEIVWPRLEGEPSIYEGYLPEDTDISDGNIDVSVEMAKLMYEKQKDRVSTIESKSSIYLGFFGAVVAILAFSLKDILFVQNKGVVHDVTLFFGGILIIYILQVMRYSIKALERRGYHSFDETDFLHGDKRKTAISLINKVKKNYDVINRKVEFMTMAHEFAKRIIGMLYFAAIGMIFTSSGKYVLSIPDVNLAISAITINLRWSDYILGMLSVLVIIIVLRVRKIEKKFRATVRHPL